MAWLRILPPDGHPGTLINPEFLIPCSEIARYHYGMQRLLTDTFNGDILLKHESYRYAGIAFNGHRFVSAGATNKRVDAADDGAGDETLFESERYAYAQLRAMSTRMIASAQVAKHRTIEALPPFLEEAHISGNIVDMRSESGHCIKFLRIYHFAPRGGSKLRNGGAE